MRQMTGFENIKKNFGFGCMRLPIVLGGCRSYFARNKLCHSLRGILPDACGGTLAGYGGGALRFRRSFGSFSEKIAEKPLPALV